MTAVTTRDRQYARTEAARQTERRSRCYWRPGCPGEPVAQQHVHWTPDGWEDQPFSVCAQDEPAVLGRRDFRPWDGGQAA